MSKKIFFISLVLLVSLFFGTTNKASADASALLQQAEMLVKDGQYDQAEAIYKQIVTDYPETEEALEAQKSLVILYIKTDKDNEAEAAYQQLISEFSGHEGIAEAIWNIGMNHNQAKRPEKAYQIHKYNVNSFPNDKYAMWSQVEITYYHIIDGNDADADTAFDNLLTIFSQQDTLPKEICQVAVMYSKFYRPDKALKLHLYNIKHFPESIYAMWSQAEIVKSHIRDGNDIAADAAFDKLLRVFSKQPTLPKEIHYIAKKYEEGKKYDKALDIYQYNIEHFPNDMHAMWSQVRIVYSHIRDGNDAAADAAFDELLTIFSDQPTLSKEVYQVANRLSEAENIERARQLYQYIIDRWSLDVDINSRKFVAMSYISLSLDAEVQVAIENLNRDFKDHPDLPLVLWQASEAYYNEAFRYENKGLTERAEEYLNNVISMGKEFIEKSPHSSYAAEAHYILAICYRRIGMHEKAIEYFQKVIDEYPNFKYAPYSLFIIGRIYHSLKKDGSLTTSEADPKIQQAYGNLISRYPDSEFAGRAQRQLERLRLLRPIQIEDKADGK